MRRKLSLVLGLAFCLCGCNSMEPTSETTYPSTEESAKVETTKTQVAFGSTTDTSVYTFKSKAATVTTILPTQNIIRNNVTTEDVTTEKVTEKTTEKKVTKTTEKRTEQKTTQPKTETTTESTEAKIEKSTDVGDIAMGDSETYGSENTEVYVEEPVTEAPEKQEFGYKLQYSAVYNVTDNHLTRRNGSLRFNGHRETWYSTNEGAGKNTARSIPGKHVADDGTIRDADGYICVASSDLKFYSVVLTTVGPGKVYDCGCSHGTIDVYTNW